MLEPATKNSLVTGARMLAESFQLVQYQSNTYIPVHWRTLVPGLYAAEEQVWLPLSRRDKSLLGNKLANILFTSDSDITNFDIMLRQMAIQVETPKQELLLRTREGLRALNSSGQLVVPDGQFRPNYLEPMVNDHPDAKARVLQVMTEWLNSEEEAHSLLHHLATSLSPAMSAVKYVLLIGDGRNGKSLLLEMITDLFGEKNISNITRQQISARLPTVAELNGKLLNIVFDGSAEYIKDSGMEKTLIAAETGVVRMLYENGSTMVRTNALFIEGLNSEPKSRDKSGALQKRMSRFFFPNVYALDPVFNSLMRRPQMLGALLALLLDHYVQPKDVALKLRQTSQAATLQVEQQILNDPLLQFVEHLCTQDAKQIKTLRAGTMLLDPFVSAFQAWGLGQGMRDYSTADLNKMTKAHFNATRKTQRAGAGWVKVWALNSPKDELNNLLDHLEGGTP